MKLLWVSSLFAFFASVQLLAAEPSPIDLVATHGYVYVNLPRSPRSDVILTLRGVVDRKEYPLRRREDVEKNAYGAWLPAGQYELAKWGRFNWDKYVPINVQVGRITDLGAFVQFYIGADHGVVLPVRHPDYASVKDAIEEFRTIVVSEDPLVWTVSSPPKPFDLGTPIDGIDPITILLETYKHKRDLPLLRTRLFEAKSIDEFLEIAKTGIPPITTYGSADGAGNLYFGADIGQVRVRASNGTWTALDTGTMAAILAVGTHDTDVLAGASTGLLLLNSDHEHWTRRASLGPHEAVVSVIYADPNWLIATIHTAVAKNKATVVDAIKVYSVDGSVNNLPEVIKEVKIDSKNLSNAWQGPAPQLTKDAYFLNASTNLLRLDLSTMHWTPINPPVQPDGFSVSSTAIISAYHIQGAFSRLAVSSDQGETWRKLDAPPWQIEDVYFDNKSRGRATKLKVTPLGATHEFFEYDATKDRWMKITDSPNRCSNIIYDDKHQPRFCVTNGGSILSRAGKDWAAEFVAE